MKVTNLKRSPMKVARAAGLRYVAGDALEIRRLRAARGFRYVDAAGRTVRARRVLRRIAGLAIPPAWTEVRISRQPRAHLQATGRDARGRIQHRYHPHWIEVRDATKYHRMRAFGKALPHLRGRVGRDLGRAGLSREKVIALVVSLLDKTLIRV